MFFYLFPGSSKNFNSGKPVFLVLSICFIRNVSYNLLLGRGSYISHDSSLKIVEDFVCYLFYVNNVFFIYYIYFGCIKCFKLYSFILIIFQLLYFSKYFFSFVDISCVGIKVGQTTILDQIICRFCQYEYHGLWHASHAIHWQSSLKQQS